MNNNLQFGEHNVENLDEDNNNISIRLMYSKDRLVEVNITEILTNENARGELKIDEETLLLI